MLIYPAYYAQFKCIASRCRHSCCVGWEIDVDETSLARYEALPGPLGDKLRASIAREDGCAHFILAEHDRCPFLQADGLCEIICAQGENALCQICADHPRFRHFFADRTEIGLGLCCEAAAELILSQREPMVLLAQGDPDGEADPEESALLALRARLMAVAQDRGRSMASRLDALLAMSGLELPEDWPDVLLSCERLDEAWTPLVQAVKDMSIPAPPEDWAVPLEQLLCYFLYRHIPGALEDGDVPGRIALCVLSVIAVRDVALANDLPLADAARMYSAEVEYSEENIQLLLDAML